MPNNVIQKVYNGGNEYLVGGGSEGQEVVYLTQAEYDALPASKLTDGKIYKIKTSGVAPTPGGGGTVGLDSNIVLNPINMFTNGGNSIYHDSSLRAIVYNTIGYEVYRYNYSTGNSGGAFTYDKYLFIKDSAYSRITKLDLTDLTTEVFNLNMSGKSYRIDGWKAEGDYIYATGQSTSSGALIGFTIKIQISNFSTYENITGEEYDAVANYANSINGLFYAQDGSDYVASDINGTEVKRYVGVGTITGIANGKLWRTVGDVSYAIATI